MRIAFFHNIPSGGAKISHYEQIKRLSKNHQIDLYTQKGTDEKFFSLADFVEKKIEFEFKEIWAPLFLFFLNPFFAILRLYRFEKIAKEIAQRINSENYHIVYLTQGLPMPAPSILRHLRIPSVYYCHEPPRKFYESQFATGEAADSSLRSKLTRLFYLPYEYLYKMIDRINIKFANKVITCSFYERETIKKIYKIEAEVLYHGVDIETFKPLNIEKEDTVVSVGAFDSTKGHDFIIGSLALLKYPPKLIIVVDREYGDEEGKIRDLAREKRIDIEILKKVSAKRLVEIYNKAKITLCAQILEPFGLVPLESMACQTPVVAVKEGGLRESVLDGITGILTKRDEKEFSQAIKFLLENEDTRQDYGKNAREYVLKNWRWEEAVNRLEEIFQIESLRKRN